MTGLDAPDICVAKDIRMVVEVYRAGAARAAVVDGRTT
jgi:hypothetical protein